MTDFVMGLQAGAVFLVACVLFALSIFTFLEKCGKINKDWEKGGKVAGKSAKSGKNPAEKSAKSGTKLENDVIAAKNDEIKKQLLAERAAIRNFYLYDGSEQKDPFEIAQEEMEKGGE